MLSRLFPLAPAALLPVNLLLAFALAASGRPGEPARTRPTTGSAGESAVLILSTTANRGEIEPCG